MDFLGGHDDAGGRCEGGSVGFVGGGRVGGFVEGFEELGVGGFEGGGGVGGSVLAHSYG